MRRGECGRQPVPVISRTHVHLQTTPTLERSYPTRSLHRHPDRRSQVSDPRALHRRSSGLKGYVVDRILCRVLQKGHASLSTIQHRPRSDAYIPSACRKGTLGNDSTTMVPRSGASSNRSPARPVRCHGRSQSLTCAGRRGKGRAAAPTGSRLARSRRASPSRSPHRTNLVLVDGCPCHRISPHFQRSMSELPTRTSAIERQIDCTIVNHVCPVPSSGWSKYRTAKGPKSHYCWTGHHHGYSAVKSHLIRAISISTFAARNGSAGTRVRPPAASPDASAV